MCKMTTDRHVVACGICHARTQYTDMKPFILGVMICVKCWRKYQFPAGDVEVDV